MTTVVLDSYALLVYFEKQPGWDEVAELLTEAAAGAHRLLLSVVNWGEVTYITLRVYGEATARRVVEAMDALPVEIVDAGRPVTAAAARLKAGGGLAYADCFAAALALIEEGEVVTGDPEFERIEGEVAVRWLPRVGG